MAGGRQRRGSFAGMPSSSLSFMGDMPGVSQQQPPMKRYTFNRRASTGSLGTNAMPLPMANSFGAFDMTSLSSSLPVIDTYGGFGPISQTFPMGYDVGGMNGMPLSSMSMGSITNMMPMSGMSFGGMPMPRTNLGFGGSFNTFPAATASNPLPFMGMQPSPPQNNMALPMETARDSQMLDQYATTGPAPGYVDMGNGYVEEDM